MDALNETVKRIDRDRWTTLANAGSMVLLVVGLLWINGCETSGYNPVTGERGGRDQIIGDTANAIADLQSENAIALATVDSNNAKIERLGTVAQTSVAEIDAELEARAGAVTSIIANLPRILAGDPIAIATIVGGVGLTWFGARGRGLKQDNKRKDSIIANGGSGGASSPPAT